MSLSEKEFWISPDDPRPLQISKRLGTTLGWFLIGVAGLTAGVWAGGILGAIILGASILGLSVGIAHVVSNPSAVPGEDAEQDPIQRARIAMPQIGNEQPARESSFASAVLKSRSQNGHRHH